MAKFGFAGLVLAVCACDKPDDRMQSTSSMTAASAMAVNDKKPPMAPKMGASANHIG